MVLYSILLDPQVINVCMRIINIMTNPIGEIQGVMLQNILSDQISKHERGILEKLNNLNANDLFIKWSNVIRSIDELINIVFFELNNEEELKFIASIPLDFTIASSKENIEQITSILVKRFNKGVAGRFLNLIVTTTAINIAFKLNDQNSFGKGLSLDTVGEAALYYQSRRKHIISLLYLIPTYSIGSVKYEQSDLINQFLPLIDHSFIGLTTINQQLLLSYIYSDFTITSDGHKMLGNYQIEDLEGLFMEPERVSIIDKHKHRSPANEIDCLGSIDKTKVLSINELKCFIRMIENNYSEFGLMDTIFSVYKYVILEILKKQKSNYHITIKTKDLNTILRKIDIKTKPIVKKHLLFNKAENYTHASSSRSPLIKIAGRYESNVILINGFMNEIKNLELNKIKRYQIHSGFIFEDMVKNVLSKRGFTITSITRINRKEFDVVTLRNDVIYNFQCKNSFINLQLMYSDKKQFVADNKKLISYYKRALKKEEDREHLLQNKLNLKEIKHFVISRFPIVTDNSLIINFNNLEKWISSYNFK